MNFWVKDSTDSWWVRPRSSWGGEPGVYLTIQCPASVIPDLVLHFHPAQQPDLERITPSAWASVSPSIVR